MTVISRNLLLQPWPNLLNNIFTRDFFLWETFECLFSNNAISSSTRDFHCWGKYRIPFRTVSVLLLKDVSEKLKSTLRSNLFYLRLRNYNDLVSYFFRWFGLTVSVLVADLFIIWTGKGTRKSMFVIMDLGELWP